MKKCFGWLFFVLAVKFLCTSILVGVAFFVGVWDFLSVGDFGKALSDFAAFCETWSFWLEVIFTLVSWFCFAIWHKWSIRPLFEIEMGTYVPEIEIKD